MSFRPFNSNDIPVISKILLSTHMFRPHEITAVQDLLTNNFKDYCIVDENVQSFAIYRLDPCTQSSWWLNWIAVHKDHQNKGLGKDILKYAENDVKNRPGTQLFLRTSNLPSYENTKKFYHRNEYATVALIPDFYLEGDDMVILYKKLTFDLPNPAPSIAIP